MRIREENYCCSLNTWYWNSKTGSLTNNNDDNKHGNLGKNNNDIDHDGDRIISCCCCQSLLCGGTLCWCY